MSSLRQERTQALHAVRRASLLCRKIQASLMASDSQSKNDRSPVTIADYTSQAIIIECLQRFFPDDLFVAEEDSTQLVNSDLMLKVVQWAQIEFPDLTDAAVINSISRGNHTGGPEGRFWVLDPIDGTKGFLRNEQYAVALALVEKGQVVLGMLGCPEMSWSCSEAEPEKGSLFIAEKGKGAIRVSLDSGNETRLQVDSVKDPTMARFCESVESGHSSHSISHQIAEKLGVIAEPLRLDSQCKYAAVAQASASIYLRLPTQTGYQEKIWDHAGGMLLIEEAGGRVTDMDGKVLDFSKGRFLENNRGIIASNGHLHSRILEVVASLKI